MDVLVTPPAPAGITIIRPGLWLPADLAARVATWTPRTAIGQSVLRCLRHLPADAARELLEAVWRSVIVESELWVTVIRQPASPFRLGQSLVEDWSCVSRKVVTDAGVAFIVNAFQNSVELENLKYHGLGTGSTAEAASQTALVTELTTEYNPDATRATGTTTANAANIYETVATNTLDAAPGSAIQEHGVFSQAATGGGTLLDRSLTGGQTLASGDGLQSTYRLTLTSGG